MVNLDLIQIERTILVLQSLRVFYGNSRIVIQFSSVAISIECKFNTDCTLYTPFFKSFHSFSENREKSLRSSVNDKMYKTSDTIADRS